MTALLETPVGALDVSTLEERQPDVPLVCTRGRYGKDADLSEPCPDRAEWEALCLNCGHVFRRCADHHLEDVSAAEQSDWLSDFGVGIDPGQAHVCATCGAKVYIEQYVRIGA